MHRPFLWLAIEKVLCVKVMRAAPRAMGKIWFRQIPANGDDLPSFYAGKRSGGYLRRWQVAYQSGSG
ncbi:hypothetical protein AFK63_01585 [Cronobacter muytjensii ATCC 51329]|nr:hypothetical protein AFK63_01585 [Cronobacter muytjensii ATCC 51329]